MGWIIIFMIVGSVAGLAGLGGWLYQQNAGQRALTEGDPEAARLVERARAVVARLESGPSLKSLPEGTAASFRRQVDTAVRETLPELLRRKAELSAIAKRGAATGEIEREVAELERKQKDATDGAHAAVIAQNLTIARQRLENARQIGTLLERTQLQVNGLIAGLEALEDRLALTAGAAAPQLEALASVEGMLTDLNDLSTELARLGASTPPRLGP